MRRGQLSSIGHGAGRQFKNLGCRCCGEESTSTDEPGIGRDSLADGQRITNEDNLNHIFAKKHNLDSLVEKYGREEEVVKQMVQGLSGKTPVDGNYRATVNIGGSDFTITGRIVKGTPRISTTSILPK